VYPWAHRDSEIDALGHRIFSLVRDRAGRPRTEVFEEIAGFVGIENLNLMPRATVPYLDEPWYC
jgi:hypothetical protein